MNPKPLLLVALLILGAIAGCSKTGTTSTGKFSYAEEWDRPIDEKVDYPALGQGKQLEPNVFVYTCTLNRRSDSNKLWVYLPPIPPNEKVPCILIAPAGSNLLSGMLLGDGDRPEHLPYVRAGCMVVAYEIDGHETNKEGTGLITGETKEAMRAYKRARAGLVNLHHALNFALEKLPQVDPQRVYTAGHSSAGTLAVLGAEHNSRIKGCLAYAPCTDVEKLLGDGLSAVSKMIPDGAEFFHLSSPKTHAAKLSCPLFLFHADDDNVVPASESAAFADEVRKTNPHVTLVRVPTGGHHAPMIQQGIPQAIEWLKKLSAGKP